MLKSGRNFFFRALEVCVASMVLHASMAFGDESESSARSEPNRFFALPVELDADSGATNGDATMLRFMPLYGVPSADHWKVVHLNLLTIADAPGGVPGRPGNPNPEPGEKVFGIGDLVHASFFTPKTSGKRVWGFGGMLSIPIASDGRLGSGKWSAGPAFRFAYRSGPWNFGAFGGQIWSFAGDSERDDGSQFMMRGAIRRRLPNDWYFVSAPIITANWNAAGQKWVVPLGGGFGRVFNVGSDPWAISLQGYYNVIRPDGAPDWVARLALIAAIPVGKK